MDPDDQRELHSSGEAKKARNGRMNWRTAQAQRTTTPGKDAMQVDSASEDDNHSRDATSNGSSSAGPTRRGMGGMRRRRKAADPDGDNSTPSPLHHVRSDNNKSNSKGRGSGRQVYDIGGGRKEIRSNEIDNSGNNANNSDNDDNNNNNNNSNDNSSSNRSGVNGNTLPSQAEDEEVLGAEEKEVGENDSDYDDHDEDKDAEISDDENDDDVGLDVPTAVIVQLVGKVLFDDNAKTVEKSLAELADLCPSLDEISGQRREAIVDAGGHLAIVKAMERWIVDPKKNGTTAAMAVQAEGCRALGCLACRNEKIKSQICNIGGVEVIVSAMQKYLHSGSVQRYGCGALRNLTYENDESTKKAVQAGAVAALVAGMKAFPKDENIQLWGCGALLNVTLTGSAEKKCVVRAGGISAIATAAETHYDNDAIRKKARKALRDLV